MPEYKDYNKVYEETVDENKTGFKGLIKNVDKRALIWIMFVIFVFLYLSSLKGKPVDTKTYVIIGGGTALAIALSGNIKESEYLKEEQIRSILINKLKWYQKNPSEINRIPEGNIYLSEFSNLIRSPHAPHEPMEWETDWYVEDDRGYKDFYVTRQDPKSGGTNGTREGQSKGEITRFKLVIPAQERMVRQFWKHPEGPEFEY